MVLPYPARPATTMPETSASRTMTGWESSAHPSHQEVSDAGAVPDRSIRAGGQQRVAVQTTGRICPGPCCSARTLTQPQVSAK